MEMFASNIASSALSQWIQATYWLWPLLEILHFVGLSLLFGGLLIVDLRLLGFFKFIDQSKTYQLLPLVLFGFALNLVTGVLFFYGDPQRYSINVAFQIKMVLVLLAGANAAIYHFRVLPKARPLGAAVSVPWSHWPKVSASISLLLWTGVLLFGRLIPYLGTG